MSHLGKLATESKNPNSERLDHRDIPEILQLINGEDQRIAMAVRQELPVIAQVVARVVQALRNQGRIFLCGAGTSGRLAAMEAAECPPTFSTAPDMVQAIMAGAPTAFFQAVEGCEDNAATAAEELAAKALNATDVVIGISASGRTPYVLGALRYAAQIGASTTLLCASRPSQAVADFVIAPATGAEVLTGSTRMKAATAAKMVLNMITLTVMVHLGKVYENLMVDLRPNSAKLVDRAIRILTEITGCPPDRARELLAQAGNAKVAAVMYLRDADKETAIQLLQKNHGQLRPIIDSNDC